MNDHERTLHQRLRGLPISAPPAPWVETTFFAVGGLLGVGVAADDSGRELALIVSSQGRGVLDIRSGERIARDRARPDDSWLPSSNLSALGIGPLAERWIPIASIWGGGLRRRTHDGWRTTIVSPDWPVELVLLEPPGRSIFQEEPGAVLLNPHNEVRAVGFSISGGSLLLATPSELIIWGR